MKSHLRILTLNLHKGFSSFNIRFVLHELRDAIRSLEADIVFLQEVIGEHTEHAPKVSQYAFLADEVWPNHAYGKNAVTSRGHHGNAILSKFPIFESTQVDISTYKLETRGFLHCALEFRQKKSLHCICVHLGLFERHRKKQLDKISTYIQKKVPPNAPLIVAGDFNDWRHQAETAFAKKNELKDPFVELKGKPARSFPSFFPILPLDRVYSRGLETRKAKVLDSGIWKALSDHAGLLTEMVLKT